MDRFLRRLSVNLLMAAENFYLTAHGWHQVGPDAWDPPADYPFERTRKKKGLRKGHAVNSEKQKIYKDVREGIAMREKVKIGLKKIDPTDPIDLTTVAIGTGKTIKVVR